MLLRFRKEAITFMDDIEKIYFQIHVAQKHQNFLRFLLWKDGNLSKEPINHEMCAHVFGGVSFGACSNSALKRTAKKNEEKFGTETACTLGKTFILMICYNLLTQSMIQQN